MKNPDHDDWNKLEHMVQYLESTLKLPLILSADESDNLYWYADSAFAVHPNMRSHNGAGLTLGRGFAISILTMQKLRRLNVLAVDTFIRISPRAQGQQEYNISR